MTEGKKFCQNCGAQIDPRAVICPKCGVPVESRPGAGRKNPGVAAVLSFFWPGLGQIYNGDIGFGLSLMLVAVLCILLFFIFIGIPLYVAVWAYSISNAYRSAEEYNRSLGVG